MSWGNKQKKTSSLFSIVIPKKFSAPYEEIHTDEAGFTLSQGNYQTVKFPVDAKMGDDSLHDDLRCDDPSSGR